jgi:hypothetical protein
MSAECTNIGVGSVCMHVRLVVCLPMHATCVASGVCATHAWESTFIACTPLLAGAHISLLCGTVCQLHHTQPAGWPSLHAHKHVAHVCGHVWPLDGMLGECACVCACQICSPSCVTCTPASPLANNAHNTHKNMPTIVPTRFPCDLGLFSPFFG